MNVYLYDDGQLIYNDGLTFRNTNEVVSLPYNSIKNMFLFGDVVIDSKTINKLNEFDIKTFVFNKNKYNLVTGNISNGIINIAMTKAYISKKRISIAKSIMKSVWHNMISTLKIYNIEFEKSYLNMIEEINCIFNINNLLLYEAKIRKLYYSYFNQILKNNDFEFKSRTMNPAKDPINSLISFINSLLYKDTLISILNANLNPSIAYLHSATDRTSSLEYDISEIYKPVIVDRLIFKLINKKIINIEDFIINANMCIIKPNTKKLIIKIYEEMLNSTVIKRNKRIKYKNLILNDCISLRRYLLTERRQLVFYKV